MEEYRFSSAFQAIALVIHGNPARAKYKYLLDPETGGGETKPKDWLDLENPTFQWVRSVQSIEAALRSSHELARKIYKLYFNGEGIKPNKKQIAQYLGISPRLVYKTFNTLIYDIETELIKRELMHPRNDE